MAGVVAFDVNETLLDLRALDAPFERALGNSALRPQWFALMLQLSFVGGLTGRYVDFTTAQHAALRMLAQRQGTELDDRAAEAAVAAMTTLPAYPDVADGLRRLRDTPLTAVALTNSPAAVAEAQLTDAGIRDLFDRVISADSVRRLKPAPDPYLAVADASGIPIEEVRLVAAHHWDISGALAAGCKAAFVARSGMVLSPLGPQPDIVGTDIGEVVEKIVDTDL